MKTDPIDSPLVPNIWSTLMADATSYFTAMVRADAKRVRWRGRMQSYRLAYRWEQVAEAFQMPPFVSEETPTHK